jgi:hypothetical protein
VDKGIKKAKRFGWILLIFGSWVFLSTIVLLITARVGYNSPIVMNAVFGVFGIYLGYRFLQKAKRIEGEMKNGQKSNGKT